MSTAERIARYRRALLVASRTVSNENLSDTLLELRERLRLKTTAEYREAKEAPTATVAALPDARGGEG